MGRFENAMKAASRDVDFSAYDKLLQDIAFSGDDFYVVDSLAADDLLSPADDKRYLVLPLLPTGHKWVLGGAADVQAKLADCGSAGSTVAVLRREIDVSDIATFTVGNADTNDTYVNGSSISTAKLDGGEKLLIDIDSIATAAVAPMTFRILLKRVSEQALFKSF
jgi:hypothetical protein